METDKIKKVILPVAIAIVTLVALTAGATYAYFTVSASNNFGTSSATATINDVSGVTLTGASIALSMNVTATQMLSANAGTTYYATSSGVSTNSATANTIGTATVDGSDSGTYVCSYTISIAKSNDTLISALQSTGNTDEVYLYVNGSAYDLHDQTTWPMTVSGTLTVTASSPKTLTAGLSVTNSTNDQTSYLAGTGTTLTFTVSAFDCELSAG